MKYICLIFTAASLVACGGGPQQTLPPELMGSPVNSNPGATQNANTGLPFDTSAPVSIDAENETAEVVTETTEDLAIDQAEENSNTPVSSAVAQNCEALTNDLETSFADMNFCNTNDDCQVARGSCPFGCYLFHNAAIDFADYQPALEAYQTSCNPCEYQCAEAPRAADRRCVEGRCIDARFQD